MSKNYDFSGWATKNDLKCSDGRTIRKDAFKDNDGKTVPLVWSHQHSDPLYVLGHALLENRDEGVYAYCTLNDTDAGVTAKQLVQHGDVTALSIYANQLKQKGGDVIHGAIKEVSLVLAGANPGAFIDSVVAHSDDTDEEAVIYTGEFLYHEDADDSSDDGDDEKSDSADEKKETKDDEKKEAKDDERTVKDVFDEFTEEQKKVVYYLIGQAIADQKNKQGDDSDEEAKHSDEEEAKHSDEEGEDFMKKNVFEGSENEQMDTLSHSEMETIIGDAKRFGSMKESFLAHADEYGIKDIDYLFPEDHNLNNPPEFIKRDTTWVDVVMRGVHHTPFSRIKSQFADITEDDARARGYMKGKLKKEEVFTLLKRSTSPTTIYKKQKMDRDDVIDITDFDVIAWLKTEMRMMLDEEIARAIVFGDGRPASSDDKINELNIRPIVKDEELYTINYTVPTAGEGSNEYKELIKATIRSRKDYRGSGNPVFFTSEEVLTEMLLLEDEIGHPLYKTEQELATKLRVSRIVAVPDEILPNDIYGVYVNLNDYNVGADKGGAVSMFDDFDIDYNQQKYLIETRCSGALVKPKSAVVLKKNA